MHKGALKKQIIFRIPRGGKTGFRRGENVKIEKQFIYETEGV
jgi:hypothetical protein